MRIFVWVAISGVLLYLALKDVALDEVWASLREAQTGYIGLALGSVALNILAKSARWQVMLVAGNKSVGFGRTLISLMAGQTLNWFLPGRVGDLSRVYVIGSGGVGRSYVLGTVALEKAIDTIAYALIFLITLLLLPLPAWLSESGYTLFVLAGVVMLGVVLLVRYPDWFVRVINRTLVWAPAALRARLSKIFQSSLSSLNILRQHRVVLRLALWTVLAWATEVLNNVLTAYALGIDIPLTASLVVLIVLRAGISVPAVPGKIGVFQYLCILALGLFGVGQAAGFTYGILLQALVFLPTTLISLFTFGSLGLDPRGVTGIQMSDAREV